MGFATKIRDNILAIDKNSFQPFFEELQEADCIICSGSGRSLYSLNAALSLLTRGKTEGKPQKVVLTPDDPGFPGKSMYDAASDLEKRFNKTLLLMNSGSGSSNDPLSMAQDLSTYIEDKKSEHFSMGLLTSNLESPLAEVTKRHGHVIQIEGRGKA